MIQKRIKDKNVDNSQNLNNFFNGLILDMKKCRMLTVEMSDLVVHLH